MPRKLRRLELHRSSGLRTGHSHRAAHTQDALIILRFPFSVKYSQQILVRHTCTRSSTIVRDCAVSPPGRARGYVGAWRPAEQQACTQYDSSGWTPCKAQQCTISSEKGRSNLRPAVMAPNGPTTAFRPRRLRGNVLVSSKGRERIRSPPWIGLPVVRPKKSAI